MPNNKENNKSVSDTIRTLDRDIDEVLYGITDEEREAKENIKNLQAKINKLNSFQTLTNSSDLLEFITNTLYDQKNNLKAKSENNFEKIKNNISSNNKSINELLSNATSQQILGEERERIERYMDYRIADAFIPQVARGIDLYRDCTLSPDDVTKSSLTIKLEGNKPEAIIDEFNENIKTLKKTYKLDKKVKTWIRNGYLLGDTFVAVLKLDKEINKIILHENQSLVPKQQKVLTENEIFNFNINDENIYKKVLLDEEMNDLLNDKIKELTKASKSYSSREVTKPKGFKNYEFVDFKKEVVNKINDNIIIEDDKTKKVSYIDKYMEERNKENKNNKQPVKLPGAIIRNLLPDNTVKLELDGICFGYLYIERCGITDNTSDTFSMSATQLFAGGSSSSISSADGVNITSSTKTVSYFDTFKGSSEENKPIKQKFLTDLFVKGISKKLNKKIIEDNQQFKEIIYTLLRNDYMIEKKVKITFYEPEEVFHFKNDSDDIYGVSKLSKVMYYIKILLGTITTQAMQKISRGRDKRVIYVETGLDDDIEGSIESVIKDFKAKEIQMDAFENVTSVLQQVGTFDDYYIPKIDGEVPLEIETLSGMDVGSDNEYTEYIQKSIMTGMGLPATYVDASNDVDFSRSLVMQNNPFVREIVGKQGDATDDFLTPLVQKLYEYEFPDLVLNKTYNNTNEIDEKKSKEEKINDLENKRKNRKKSKEINEKDKAEGDTESSIERDDLDNTESDKPEDKTRQIDINDIKVELPTPQYLNLSIITESINNNQSKIEFVTNTYFDENTSDEAIMKKKQLFKRRYTRKLVPDIDWTEADEIFDLVEQELNQEKLLKDAEKAENPNNLEDDETDSEDFGGDDF